MRLALVISVFICGALTLPQKPIYSNQYASVYYQNKVPEVKVSEAEVTESESVEIQQTSKQELEKNKDQDNVVVEDKLSEPIEVEGLKEETVYYIYHPGGPLQRVVYWAREEPRNKAYTALFRYENVEPIREPIYTYDPETFVLQQLQR